MSVSMSICTSIPFKIKVFPPIYLHEYEAIHILHKTGDQNMIGQYTDSSAVYLNKVAEVFLLNISL